MTVADTGEQVHLVLPADPAYARVARIAAAHLALRRGFSLAEIDDLRLVVDEATAMLIGEGSDASIDIGYNIVGDTLAVTAQLVDDTVGATVHALSAERIRNFVDVVGELVDEYSVRPAQAFVALSKTKH